MSLLFVDSFDHYADGEFGLKGYDSFSSGTPEIGEGLGRRGTNCMLFSSLLNGAWIYQPVNPSGFGVVSGVAFHYTTDHNNEILAFKGDGDGDLDTPIAALQLRSDGSLRLRLGSTTVDSTVASFGTPNTYKHYELKYIPDATSGVIEARQNEVVILSFTGDTVTGVPHSGAVGQVWFGNDPSGGEGDLRYDDFYVLNTDPASDNNDYLGDVRVDAHFTDTEGDTVDFTPSAGTDNAAMVDDTNQDGDTTYVESGTVGNKDIYNMDSATLGTTVYGVQQVVCSKKTDAGSVDIDIISNKSSGSGTDKVNGNTLIGDNYIYHLAITDNDPDDGSDWDDARINATDFGFSIKSIS